MAKTLTSDETMTAILSYLGILVFIPFFAVKKRDDFIKFHLSQGLTLFVIEIILYVGFFVVGMVMPYFWMILNLIWLAVLVVCILAIIKALGGEKWEIPVVSNFKLVKL